MYKKKTKWLDILFILYLIIQVISTFISEIHKEGVTIEMLNKLTSIEILKYNFIFIIMSIIDTLITNISLIFLYLGVKLALFKHHKQKLDVNDLKKYEGYYRELIKNYNITELAYIDSFNPDYKATCTGLLLDLINRKIIEINNNKITVIKTPTNELDKTFVNSIINNKVTIPENIFFKCIKNEAHNNGLIESSSSGEFVDKRIKLFITIPLRLYIVIAFILIIFDNSSKNYLKDFGNFEEKSHQELILWEDYLIYSVIFNLNTKIIKEYEQFF